MSPSRFVALILGGVWITQLGTSLLLSSEPGGGDSCRREGIAAHFPGDRGIAKDPSVVFADDFETWTEEGSVPPAEACDVEIEGRVGAKRGDDRRAGGECEAAQEAKEPINPAPHHDMLRADAMMTGEGGAEVVAFGVGIHPTFQDRGLHRCDGFGGGAEEAFIGPEPCPEGVSLLTFQRLGPGEGNGAGQGGGEGGEKSAHDAARVTRKSARGKGDVRCVTSVGVS